MGDTCSIKDTDKDFLHFPALERVKEEGMLAIRVSVPS